MRTGVPKHNEGRRIHQHKSQRCRGTRSFAHYPGKNGQPDALLPVRRIVERDVELRHLMGQRVEREPVIELPVISGACDPNRQVSGIPWMHESATRERERAELPTVSDIADGDEGRRQHTDHPGNHARCRRQSQSTNDGGDVRTPAEGRAASRDVRCARRDSNPQPPDP